MRQWLGSIVFTTYLFGSVAIYGSLVLLAAPFPRAVAYRLVLLWVDSVLWVLRVLCRLDFVVEGAEHLPDEPSVVLVKHSSAWETIAQLKILPAQTWVLKRELLWAPILGWVIRKLRPIAIDRRAGRSAVQQVIDQGRQRLADGLWVVIFPEGTRVAAGQTRRYGLGGALLAGATGKPVIPVAHNAGDFWPRRGWLKRPGTIRFVIGPPIPTAGRDARDVTEEVRRWIDARLTTLGSPPAPVTVAAAAGPYPPAGD
jgi:1-acyl-sn-glycerol-3-phosphate acyltransferase